ncbi:MAG: hypothetical protein WBF36_03340 [Desulfobulbales bacterium]
MPKIPIMTKNRIVTNGATLTRFDVFSLFPIIISTHVRQLIREARFFKDYLHVGDILAHTW